MQIRILREIERSERAIRSTDFLLTKQQDRLIYKVRNVDVQSRLAAQLHQRQEARPEIMPVPDAAV
jgi:hypothetical protein